MVLYAQMQLLSQKLRTFWLLLDVNYLKWGKMPLLFRMMGSGWVRWNNFTYNVNLIIKPKPVPLVDISSHETRCSGEQVYCLFSFILILLTQSITDPNIKQICKCLLNQTLLSLSSHWISIYCRNLLMYKIFKLIALRKPRWHPPPSFFLSFPSFSFFLSFLLI